jgi:hypothetical protein
VLQRLAPIFSPAINENIAAVTGALDGGGLVTPRLLPTREGRLWLDLGGDDGVWRLQTFVPGASFDKVQSPAQAHAAGAWSRAFIAPSTALPTPSMAYAKACTTPPSTWCGCAKRCPCTAITASWRRFAPVAETILAHAQALDPLPALPLRLCHGDLKLNNILFAGETPPASEQALCLIDLDTVGPMRLPTSWAMPGARGATAAAKTPPSARIDSMSFARRSRVMPRASGES